VKLPACYVGNVSLMQLGNRPEDSLAKMRLGFDAPLDGQEVTVMLDFFPKAGALVLERRQEIHAQNTVVELSGASNVYVSGVKQTDITGEAASINATLVGVAVLSPVTDLTLSGATYETRADADPLFTRPQVAELVHSYLGSADARHPLASPLHGRHSGMPSTRIHVGDDEVLLDDSLRYVERAVAAGVDARADVWMGMPHGVPGSIGRLKAAAQALDAIGAFLAERLQAHPSP